MTARTSLFSLAFAFFAAAALAQTKSEDCPMHQTHHPAEAAAPAAADAQAQHEHAVSPQHEHAMSPQHDHAMSPYAGKAGSEVKALTAEEIQAYREGTGMGLAKPAELNHYPGPRHVLDLAADLQLTDAQTAELKIVFGRMHEEAVALGSRIIEKEKSLDQAFASGAIDEGKLRALTAGIASLQADLRAAHLKAHLATKRILTATQVARYDELRGYPKAAGS
jgi:Spy/CpxP family protein refolding chaperone